MSPAGYASVVCRQVVPKTSAREASATFLVLAPSATATATPTAAAQWLSGVTPNR